MTLDRRSLLLAAPAAGPLLAAAGPAAAQTSDIDAAPAHGIDATHLGIIADTGVPVTEALQNAINIAAERRRALLLPPGVINSATVTLRPGSRLIGAGAATRLSVLGQGPLIIAEEAGDIALADLMLDSGTPHEGEAPAGVSLVMLTACERLVLARLAVVGGGRGLALERCGGQVRECRITGAREAAIHCLDATGLEIVHNTIADCANNGIQVWRSEPGADRTLVAHNRVSRIAAEGGGSGQNGNAINVFRAGNVIVSANQIEDCAYSAIRANAASDCVISGNSCTGLGEVAIYSEFAFEGAVISSNLVDGAASGIAITNFNEGGRLAVCSGNVVRNLSVRDHFDRRGVGIGAEADTVVTGNVIEKAPVAGITLGWGEHLRNVAATNNVVRECGVGIAVSVAEGAGAALISGNLIASPAGAAIQGYEWDQAVGGDLVSGAPTRWPQLAISGNLKA